MGVRCFLIGQPIKMAEDAKPNGRPRKDVGIGEELARVKGLVAHKTVQVDLVAPPGIL